MKSLIMTAILFCSLSALNSTETSDRAGLSNLKMTTFNLKWFGLGGSLWNTPDMEFRQETLKSFIFQEMGDSDVIVFSEVTDPKLLSEILAPTFECVTYDRGESIRHQRVVTCYQASQFRSEKYDEDYEIPEVALGSKMQRPASQVKICHKKGKCFLQVIGLHLAAGLKSEKRLEQITFLADDLKKQSSPLPTVITGDFNSYITSQSGLDKDDIDLFMEELSTKKRYYKSVNRGLKTYSSGEWARTYDHIVISNDLKASSVESYEACKVKPDLSKTFIPYESFRKYYSDHCHVTAQLNLK